MSKIAALRKLAHKPPKSMTRLDEQCKAIAETMTEINGGEYRFVVNHDSCFVMVVRVLGSV